jgi:hypothetical protein
MPTNYEPADDVRVFEGTDDDQDVEGSRLPLLIVIALLVLAAFGGVVWLAYQRGVQQGHAEVPRVIAADQTPAKVPPANAGGTQTPYTGLKIYQQPAPANEGAAADAAGPAPSQAPAANAAPTPVPPASMPAEVPATTPPLKVVEVAPVPPTAAKPAPAKPQVAAPPAPQKPQVVVQAAPPPPTHVAAPAVVAPPVVAPVVSAPAASAPPSGSGLLQIGSYKSEAEANSAWSTYKSKHAALLSGISPDVKQVDLGAKGTWYRLRIVAGDKSAAMSLCEKLKAEGAVCIPTK